MSPRGPTPTPSGLTPDPSGSAPAPSGPIERRKGKVGLQYLLPKRLTLLQQSLHMYLYLPFTVFPLCVIYYCIKINVLYFLVLCKKSSSPCNTCIVGQLCMACGLNMVDLFIHYCSFFNRDDLRRRLGDEIFAGFTESEEEEPGSPAPLTAPGPIAAPDPAAAPAPAPRRPASRSYAEAVRGHLGCRARGRGRRRRQGHDRGDRGRGTLDWGDRGRGRGSRGRSASTWQRRPRPSMSQESVSLPH